MDVLLLSRLQFAVATYFHFLFVPLTLGLSLLLAVMETMYVRTGNHEYKAMAKFWGKLFLINFVIGIVTGITLEFQFGTNWSRYSRYVGDVFGPLLAIEATVAFFLESTFVAVWAFGWEKLSRRMHAVSIWLVAIAANTSAVWILIANSWMQSPVGFVMKNGKPVLDNLVTVITQKYAALTIMHTLGSAYILTGFFVMGISAYHILRRRDLSFFLKSFRLALVFALIFSIFEIVEGHLHGVNLASKQPAKLASMESHWSTESHAPIYLFLIPDPDNERNKVEIGPVPGALSIMAYHRPNTVVKGLKDIPKSERPPVIATFIAFRLMVTLGGFFFLLTIIGWFRRHTLESSPLFLKTIIYAMPLPYIACALGWTVTEVGRQPWIVYGLMKTADAASPISTIQVSVSLVAFTIIYTFLGITAFYLIAKYARRGPESSLNTEKGGAGNA
ncbi:MAG: cytochrome ubiquinol oxidase subunit I [Syntrophobacterales bacterium]|jgi:cytochrome d ubiquinol oxidase subunit I|nr:cytochrome ubiquinol oxidase subunit I [Syntrophobacterales bacterium]